MQNVIDGRKRPNAGSPAKNGFGTFQVHYASTAQKNFIRKLFMERETHDIRVPDYDTLNKKASSALITQLLTCRMKNAAHFPASITRPATDKQLAFVTKLAGEHVVPDEVAETVQTILAGNAVDMRACSKAIDLLMKAPYATSTNKDAAPRATEPGVYRHDGEIFIVKPNREKTRVYAKRIVEIGGTRITEAGTFVNVEFEFAPGMIHKLTATEKLSLEEGKAYTIRYGKCICCGRKLEAGQSVDRGIGPVCIKYFA